MPHPLDLDMVKTMDNPEYNPYVSALALGLGDGLTIERLRACSGGLHKMRLLHHDSNITVERDYADHEEVVAVRDELVVKLQAKLAERGLTWGWPIQGDHNARR
jgi:hypothetical protein